MKPGHSDGQEETTKVVMERGELEKMDRQIDKLIAGMQKMSEMLEAAQGAMRTRLDSIEQRLSALEASPYFTHQHDTEN